MRNFIKAELYLTLKNRAYRILFAVASGLILILNFLIVGGRAEDVTDSQMFCGRIQGFAFIFIFGIIGMAIVSGISLGDLSGKGSAKNVISNGLSRWKYVVGKILVTTAVLVVYLVLFFLLHLGFAVISDGTEAFRANLPMVREFLMTAGRACFFWAVWVTVLIAFELMIPNVAVGAVVGTMLSLNGASSVLMLLSTRIPAIQEPITYVAKRLPSQVMSMFYSSYLSPSTDTLFHVQAPETEAYLVSGVLGILMTAIGIFSFRRREL